jgi:quinol monooxygenase YgiN
MNNKLVLILGASAIAATLSGCALTDKTQNPSIRVAEIEIDPAQQANYAAIVKEEIEASVRVEPGVLALYAVVEKDTSAHVIVFEMYASEAAYRAHLESPHFNK